MILHTIIEPAAEASHISTGTGTVVIAAVENVAAAAAHTPMQNGHVIRSTTVVPPRLGSAQLMNAARGLSKIVSLMMNLLIR